MTSNTSSGVPSGLASVALRTRDGQTVSELGEKLYLESNTISPLLKRLEALGYVARRRDAADERRVEVRLTEAGRSLCERASSVPGRILAASLLSAAEAKDIAAGIKSLRDSLTRDSPK